MQNSKAANEDLIFQKKKRFLKRHQRIMKKIERLEEKLLDLDNRLITVRSQRITDMPRGGIPISQADLISDKEETQERINALILQAKEIRREIYAALDTLDDFREVEVLELFFIYNMSLDKIAEKIGYTERHTIRFYSSAIRHLDEDVTNLSQACQ